jgi:hypothetical protein
MEGPRIGSEGSVGEDLEAAAANRRRIAGLQADRTRMPKTAKDDPSKAAGRRKNTREPADRKGS